MSKNKQPAKPETPKPRTGSRHKPRRMVALPLDLYERLAAFAAKNDRPLARELRRAVEGHIGEGG